MIIGTVVGRRITVVPLAPEGSPPMAFDECPWCTLVLSLSCKTYPHIGQPKKPPPPPGCTWIHNVWRCPRASTATEMFVARHPQYSAKDILVPLDNLNNQICLACIVVAKAAQRPS